MSALSEFLDARLQEDRQPLEAAARWLHPNAVRRLRAECDAKEKVLDLYYEYVSNHDDHGINPHSGNLHGPAEANVMYRALWEMSLPYREHPEFDDGWAWKPRAELRP